MSVTLYDEALLKKLKYWVKGQDITILGVDQSTDLFRYRSDINNDEPLKMPIISLSRSPSISITSTTKQPLTFDGLKDTSSKSKTNQMNAIPITIPYQLDIYTRYNYEAQEYVRNFVFNLINYPKVDFEVPYNDSKLIMNGFIYIDGEINDNSDIPERLIRDQFTRETISFNVRGYLYDYRAYDNWKMDADQMTLIVTEAEIASKDSIQKF